jgi:hypothetical protein
VTESPWKPDDEEQLLALRAAGFKWYIIAKKLGRTEAATVSRAGTLKLRRPTPEQTSGCDRKSNSTKKAK